MSVSNVSVGIDYHQASVRMTVLGPEGSRYGSLDLSISVQSVIEYVSGYGTVKGVALEACTEGIPRLFHPT
jgi:hypothetical protein